MCIISLFMARYVAASNIFGEWRIHDLSKHGFLVSTCTVLMECDFHVSGYFIWIIFIGSIRNLSAPFVLRLKKLNVLYQHMQKSWKT